MIFIFNETFTYKVVLLAKRPLAFEYITARTLMLFYFSYGNQLYSQRIWRCETFLNCKQLQISRAYKDEMSSPDRRISIKINIISIMRFIITIIIITSTIL